MKLLLVSLFCLVSMGIFVAEILAEEEQPGAMQVALSEQTQLCVLCHKKYTPGIVEDWLTSRHSKVTPEMALAKPVLERRISSDIIPETFRSVVIGCYECHGQNAPSHKDNFDHFGFKINVVVSPNDCKTCHPVEVGQYSVSKKANALDIFAKKSFISYLCRNGSGFKRD